MAGATRRGGAGACPASAKIFPLKFLGAPGAVLSLAVVVESDTSARGSERGVVRSGSAVEEEEEADVGREDDVLDSLNSRITRAVADFEATSYNSLRPRDDGDLRAVRDDDFRPGSCCSARREDPRPSSARRDDPPPRELFFFSPTTGSAAECRPSSMMCRGRMPDAGGNWSVLQPCASTTTEEKTGSCRIFSFVAVGLDEKIVFADETTDPLLQDAALLGIETEGKLGRAVSRERTFCSTFIRYYLDDSIYVVPRGSRGNNILTDIRSWPEITDENKECRRCGSRCRIVHNFCPRGCTPGVDLNAVENKGLFFGQEHRPKEGI